jgi:hypoxanthine phosphoribosyltransferase
VPDFLGVSLPNEWLVGYSMDYNNMFREIGHICYINEEAKQEFRQ